MATAGTRGHSIDEVVEEWADKQPHRGSPNWRTRRTLLHLNGKRRELDQLASLVIGAEKAVDFLLGEGDVDGVRSVLADLSERARQVRECPDA